MFQLCSELWSDVAKVILRTTSTRRIKKLNATSKHGGSRQVKMKNSQSDLFLSPMGWKNQMLQRYCSYFPRLRFPCARCIFYLVSRPSTWLHVWAGRLWSFVKDLVVVGIWTFKSSEVGRQQSFSETETICGLNWSSLSGTMKCYMTMLQWHLNFIIENKWVWIKWEKKQISSVFLMVCINIIFLLSYSSWLTDKWCSEPCRHSVFSTAIRVDSLSYYNVGAQIRHIVYTPAFRQFTHYLFGLFFQIETVPTINHYFSFQHLIVKNTLNFSVNK